VREFHEYASKNPLWERKQNMYQYNQLWKRI
jgi:hypothetical protein